MWVWGMCMPWCECVELSGQLFRNQSFSSQCRFWELNLGHLAWPQAPSPAEASHYPLTYFISMQNLLYIFLVAENVVQGTIQPLLRWHLYSSKKSRHFTNSHIQKISSWKRKELWASCWCWSPQRVGNNVSELMTTFKQSPVERAEGKGPGHKTKKEEKALFKVKKVRDTQEAQGQGI